MEVEKTRSLFERGRARWPGLQLAFEAFSAQVRPHLKQLAVIEETQVCAEDLFLAAACLSRLPGAVDRLDTFAWPAIERHLRRKEHDEHRLSELRQALLIHIFVPESIEHAPRLAEYTGRGPLLVWLRMTAMRLWLNSKRHEARHNDRNESYATRAASVDVEMSFIRGRFEEDFVSVVRTAVAQLSDDERFLLQLRYREELTSDQIAVLLKTSRVTAHRRVVSAREVLAGKMRDGLRVRLALSEAGLTQVVGMWWSGIVPALAAELKDGLFSPA